MWIFIKLFYDSRLSSLELSISFIFSKQIGQSLSESNDSGLWILYLRSSFVDKLNNDIKSNKH